MTTMSVGNNDETLDKSLLTVSEVDYLEKKDGGMMLDQVTFNSFSFHWISINILREDEVVSFKYLILDERKYE